MNDASSGPAAAVRTNLPRRVIECFVAIEPMRGADAMVGVCALGYEHLDRVIDDRRAARVRNVGGRIELAALAAAMWARRLWPKAEHVVIHLSGEYLTRRVEAILREVWRGGRDLEGAGVELAGGLEADRTDRPTTPRMEEALMLARTGRPSLELNCDDLFVEAVGPSRLAPDTD